MKFPTFAANEEKELDLYCFGVALKPCCKGVCIMKHFEGKAEKATKFVKQCYNEVISMSSTEKRTHIKQKMISSIKGYGDSGRVVHAWKVGEAPGIVIEDVCRACFQNCYGIANSTVIYIDGEIKNGEVASVRERPFGDKNCDPPVSDEVINALKALLKKRNRELTQKQQAMLRIPNSPSSFTCYTWMANHFDLVGDKMPNKNEIHLEPIGIEEVFEEYVEDMVAAKTPSIHLRSFYSMWENCFPYVKIREFKAVTCKYYR